MQLSGKFTKYTLTARTKRLIYNHDNRKVIDDEWLSRIPPSQFEYFKTTHDLEPTVGSFLHLESLHTLKLGGLRKSLVPGVLPNNLKTLSIELDHRDGVINIEEGSLPSSLTSLKLLDSFGTLTPTTIPSSVTKLTLTGYTITGSIVPRHVKRLIYSNEDEEFDAKLYELPDSLEYLNVLCYEDAEPNNIESIVGVCTKLITLEMRYRLWRSEEFKVGKIPPSVTDLRISLRNVRGDNQSLNVILPTNLQNTGRI
ncbi:hypothetical protein SAMD00019534_006390 [Acytostelium subglobosum LB1]|uniref:hypothetical protein n=1 Tax=Acytostelium subglobosum LB1 TaxID=1410327 RepID=UPI000644C2D3|nr:hypothetical protein SAMD00019534_006390 [Acytostelium subglobosum LB1]GAM17464.1 hypothetical protein SAMD00019534_006390 [Acytostelium subglobosum LB1]|eukprot:XP_012759526.1 hypothetical protein SAMD00019534_006390 [Acytostelium subglobosum LB1]